MISFVRSNDGSLSGVLLKDGDTKVFNVSRGSVNYKPVLSAIQSNNEDDLLKALNVENTVNSFTGLSTVEVKNGTVYFQGKELHNSLTTRMLDMMSDGFSIEPMSKFLVNLMENPSSKAVTELYDFLDHRNLPITEDGCFLAYKCVRENYLDKYSGTYSNVVGSVHEMQRNQVDDDRNRTCSHGFHVGGLEYSGPNGAYWSTGDRVLIVKVNPKDAVSVPSDHQAQKLRVSRYEVVAEYQQPLSGSLYDNKANQVNSDVVFEEHHDVDELLVGDEVSFTYTKRDLSQSTRNGTVLSTDDQYNCILVEQDNGHTRSFRKSGISNLTIHNYE